MAVVYRIIFYAIFVYYIIVITKNNLVFSLNFEQTQIREIDDYALQFAMHEMRTDLENSELKKIIFRFDYAYGWLYWITYSIFGLIIIRFNPTSLDEETLVIFASRELTLFIYLLTIILIYFTTKKLGIFENLFRKGYIYLILIMYAFSPALMRYVESAKPVIFSIFLMHIAVYLLFPVLTVKMNQKDITRRIVGTYIFFGLATGSKLTIIFSFPVILLCFLLIYQKYNVNNLKIYKFNLSKITCAIIYLISAVFAISPAIYFYPLKSIDSVLEKVKAYSTLSSNLTFLSEDGIYNFIGSVQSISPGLIPLIVLITFLLIRTSKIGKWKTLSIYLFPYFIILILSYTLGNGILWIVSYTLGISVILYFMHFIIISKLFSDTILKSVIVGTTTLIIILFNYLNELPKLELNSYYKFNYFVDRQNEMMKNKVLEENSELKNRYPQTFLVNKVTLQDFETPLIWSNFRVGMRIYLTYNNWDEGVEQYGGVTEVIILKTNKDYSQFSKSESIINLIRFGRFGDMLCRLDYTGTIYTVYLCK